MLVNKIKYFGSSILTLDLAYENCRFKNELNICTYIPFFNLKRIFDRKILGPQQKP
jgi:hypothetical protein